MTTPTLLLLVGAPGVGKSTLMGTLTAAWRPWPRPDHPVPHILYLDPATAETRAVELGVLRHGHPGADALRMDIATKAKSWLATHPARLVLADGARLATRPWIDTAAATGYHPVIALLTAPQPVLDERCAKRGTTQNPSWRAGAATRATRLHAWAAARDGCTTLTLDATQPPTLLATQLREGMPA